MTVATLTLLASLYFIYFYVVRGGIDGGSLGTLGDFVGGNLNPILTFITTLLLIETLQLQKKATVAAEESASDARETFKQQGLLIKTQIFESSFFNLINLCLEDYKNNKIHLGGEVFEGGKACYLVEQQFLERKFKEEDPAAIIADLDDLHGDIIFNSIKSFSSVFGFICENAPEEIRDRYISLALKLTPLPVIYLACIAKLHTSWPLVKDFDRAGIFEKSAFEKLLNAYR